jgi:hypothetical protein
MKSIAAGGVTLALFLSACASQQQSPAPPSLKLVAEAPTDSGAMPPPPTGAQLLAQQPAEVQAAIKEYQQDGKMARLPNGRAHTLSLQPKTGARGQLRTATHHRHSAAAG